MRRKILSETRFKKPAPGWELPFSSPRFQPDSEGVILAADEKPVSLQGAGVHTRNGDSIEVHFRLQGGNRGCLRFGFSGGMEAAVVALDFREKRVSLSTSDWTCVQPLATAGFRRGKRDEHVLRLEKTRGSGDLVERADIRIFLDGEPVLEAADLDILPELGVTLGVEGTRLLLRRFAHRGVPPGVPEFFRVGGWQMLNQGSIEKNLDSLGRGLRAAAELTTTASPRAPASPRLRRSR